MNTDLVVWWSMVVHCDLKMYVASTNDEIGNYTIYLQAMKR